MSEKTSNLRRNLERKDIPPEGLWKEFLSSFEPEVTKKLAPVLNYNNSNDAQQ